MDVARLRQRLLHARWGRVLLWVGLVVLVAMAINLTGIRLLGNIEAWREWLRAHSGYFLIWRLCLYSGTAYGWWWMRRRLRQREPSLEAQRRLLRAEIAAVLGLALLEGSALWRPA
jgi:hypothetical protein